MDVGFSFLPPCTHVAGECMPVLLAFDYVTQESIVQLKQFGAVHVIWVCQHQRHSTVSF